MPYNRSAAVEYAKRWALSRNPDYYNFDGSGGDCTNFISQCIYAGKKEMNYKKDVGWYYNSAYDRAAAWTSVEYLYNFLINNNSAGPRGKEIPLSNAETADIVQLSFNGTEFSHSLFITQTTPEILVCAHTYDAYNKPLRLYAFDTLRCIHIS